MARPMSAQRDPRAQQKATQSRSHVDAPTMAAAAEAALRLEDAGTPFEGIVAAVHWPSRGRMTAEQIAREALHVATFFGAREFQALVDGRDSFLSELAAAGVPWHVFLKAERQRTWKAGPREGEPILAADVAAFFAEHLERDGGRGLTVAAVNTHFGYPPPQSEKAGGLERRGQMGLGV